ncbi:MAG: hypothetical protein WC373_16155 [Smithella sp.]|jgi:hypothetical protein
MTRTSLKNSITFDFQFMRWQGITIEQLQIWEKLYPSVNIAKVLKADIPQWLDRQVLSRDPLKISAKGRKRQWKTFIAKWLQREQEKKAFV